MMSSLNFQVKMSSQSLANWSSAYPRRCPTIKILLLEYTRRTFLVMRYASFLLALHPPAK